MPPYLTHLNPILAGQHTRHSLLIYQDGLLKSSDTPSLVTVSLKMAADQTF